MRGIGIQAMTEGEGVRLSFYRLRPFQRFSVSVLQAPHWMKLADFGIFLFCDRFVTEMRYTVASVCSVS